MTYSLSRDRRKQTRDRVDRISEDGNRQLTPCRGIGESESVISGQNVSGQDFMAYTLLSHWRKQTPVICGRDVRGQESTDLQPVEA